MKIKLVFDDWARHGKSVSREEYSELAMCDFHSGTLFHGTITLTCGQAQELKEAMDRGFEPVFWVTEEKEESA